VKSLVDHLAAEIVEDAAAITMHRRTRRPDWLGLDEHHRDLPPSKIPHPLKTGDSAFPI
jgi:hypothetical protein